MLERVRREIGLPSSIRVYQGTEFVSRELDLSAYQRGASTTGSAILELIAPRMFPLMIGP